MRFDLVDLRLFLHIADAHSITHGARRANLALASASERIRGMEKMLGVALLIRDRRGVSLSPAGHDQDAMVHCDLPSDGRRMYSCLSRLGPLGKLPARSVTR